MYTIGIYIGPLIKSEIFTQHSTHHSNPLLNHLAKCAAFHALFVLSEAGHHPQVIQYPRVVKNSISTLHFTVKKYFMAQRNVQAYDPQRLSILLLPSHEKSHLSLSN